MHRNHVLFALGTALLGWANAATADELPAMARDKRSSCLRDEKGRRWRLQCDEASKVCLYAPDSEVDENGNWVRALERAGYCDVLSSSEVFDRVALETKGYRLVPAIVDAPYGWMRDERGRVFQVNFDLKRRLYFGVGWAPQRRADGEADTKRVGLDFGLFAIEWYGGPDDPTRHRLRLVEGEVFLAPFSGRMQIVRYDLSRRYKTPLLRLTTFFGKPRRGDLKLNLGLMLTGGGLEIRQVAAGVDERLWRFATGQATFDLWQSQDLYSFVRLRAGAGVDSAAIEGGLTRSAVTPSGAIEASLTLDDSGFHHLGAEVIYEAPRYFDQDAQVGATAYRLSAKAEYEVIFMAINDQPLSLHIAAGLEKRSDRPDAPDDLAFVSTVGLRFSLWAPPRMPVR